MMSYMFVHVVNVYLKVRRSDRGVRLRVPEEVGRAEVLRGRGRGHRLRTAQGTQSKLKISL